MSNAFINSNVLLGLRLNHNKVKTNLCWNVSFMISLHTGKTAFTNVSSTVTARDVSCFSYKSSAAGGSMIKDIALHLLSKCQVSGIHYEVS